ncbi:MAG: hypothetical protein WC755_08925 [Candidatus Woesearchaeota archaeon]|jgi:hypothetical protein
MTKKEFIDTMKKFIELRKFEEEINAVVRKFDQNFSILSVDKYEDLFVKTLTFAMNDEHNWVSYWIYDCDMGTNTRLMNSVKDMNGKKLQIKTLSNLYDIIINPNI